MYFSSVTDADYQYDEFFVSFYNPVTADAEPVTTFLCTAEFLYVVFQNGGIFSEDE
jgi:hypothetical protein